MGSSISVISSALIFAMIGVAVVAFARPVEAESPDDILIIANKSVGVDSLSVGQMRQIFLKERTTLAGNKVVPVHAKSSTQVRKRFNQRVLGMTTQEESAFWQDEMVRSGGKGPAEFRATVRAVFSLKGAVSYCFRKDYKEGVVKILGVI